METNTKGNVTEASVLQALVALGRHVLVPFGGGHPYDLVVHLPTGAFLRVQCKTARDVGGCAQFNSRLERLCRLAESSTSERCMFCMAA